MEIRHVVVLVANWVLARDWVQKCPSCLLWICKRYRACRTFVGSIGSGPSVCAHCPSRLVWMCKGYKACGGIVGTTCTDHRVWAECSFKTSVLVAGQLALRVMPHEWVHIVRQDKCECAIDIRHVAVLLAVLVLHRQWVQKPHWRLVWMCNWYTASATYVGTVCTRPCMIAERSP